MWQDHGGPWGGPALRGPEVFEQAPHREPERKPSVGSVADPCNSSGGKETSLNSAACAWRHTAGEDPVAGHMSTCSKEPTDAPSCEPARYSSAPNSLSSPASVHSISSPAPLISAVPNAASHFLSREILAAKSEPAPSLQQPCCDRGQSPVLAQRTKLNTSSADFVSKSQEWFQLTGPPLGTLGHRVSAHGPPGQPGGGEKPLASAPGTFTLADWFFEQPIFTQAVGSPSAPGRARRETTTVPQAPGWSQDSFRARLCWGWGGSRKIAPPAAPAPRRTWSRC